MNRQQFFYIVLFTYLLLFLIPASSVLCLRVYPITKNAEVKFGEPYTTYMNVLETGDGYFEFIITMNKSYRITFELYINNVKVQQLAFYGTEIEFRINIQKDWLKRGLNSISVLVKGGKEGETYLLSIYLYAISIIVDEPQGKGIVINSYSLLGAIKMDLILLFVILSLLGFVIIFFGYDILEKIIKKVSEHG